jgi:hypothetical protein
VREIVFALDTDDTGQREWKELARQACLRGKAVGYLPPEVYQGQKDLNEVWMAEREGIEKQSMLKMLIYEGPARGE